ncbi:MAG: hypothetical protein ACKORY_02010 [Actinomycetota bacterium]
MMVDNPEFSAREEVLAGLDRNLVTVLDWIVLEGGHHDEQVLGEENLDQAELHGTTYFIGEPTSDPYSGDVLEIAALVAENSPLGEAGLRALAGPAVSTLHLTDERLLVEFPAGESADMWVALRLRQVELDDPTRLHARMSALVALTEAAAEALR